MQKKNAPLHFSKWSGQHLGIFLNMIFPWDSILNPSGYSFGSNLKSVHGWHNLTKSQFWWLSSPHEVGLQIQCHGLPTGKIAPLQLSLRMILKWDIRAAARQVIHEASLSFPSAVGVRCEPGMDVSTIVIDNMRIWACVYETYWHSLYMFKVNTRCTNSMSQLLRNPTGWVRQYSA